MKYSILFFFIFLSGCQMAGTLFSGVSRISKVLMDDRDLKDDLTDTRINVELRDNLIRKEAKLGLDIEITVFEGEVLLNGTVPTIDFMNEVLEIAWQVDGVNKVYNYLRIDSPLSVVQVQEDGAVSGLIRTQLTLTEGVNSSNYKITMENGVIYVMGISKNGQEYDKVMRVFKDTNGVKKIVSLVKGDKLLIEDEE